MKLLQELDKVQFIYISLNMSTTTATENGQTKYELLFFPSRRNATTGDSIPKAYVQAHHAAHTTQHTQHMVLIIGIDGRSAPAD